MKKHLTILSALLLAVMVVKAQQNFTLYNMPSIPQSNLLNPALRPDCKWHIGIPGLNSNYFQYSNGGFNLKKIYDAIDHDNDSTYAINLNKVLDILSKKNYMAFKTEVSWLSAGLKYGNHYFHFSVQEKGQLRIQLPKDMFRFIIDGNGGANLGKTFDFDMKADALHYREWALGYSYALGDKFTFGGRVKYLQGFNMVETKHAVLNITTRPEDFAYLVKANVELRSASAFSRIVPRDSTDTSHFDVPRGAFFHTKNKGMAFDLGASYKLGEKWSFSASILDMGYIRWRQNTTIIKSKDPNASLVFDGLHINSADTNDIDQMARNLADSIKEKFRLVGSSGDFLSALSTEFFIGSNYKLNKRVVLGALFYGDFYNRRFYPGLTLNANLKVGKALSVNVSNTMYNRSWLNVGFGTSLNAGAYQVYTVMDNFLFPFSITSLKMMSVRFGMNLTFGRERLKPKKGAADVPGTGTVQ